MGGDAELRDLAVEVALADHGGEPVVERHALRGGGHGQRDVRVRRDAQLLEQRAQGLYGARQREHNATRARGGRTLVDDAARDQDEGEHDVQHAERVRAQWVAVRERED